MLYPIAIELGDEQTAYGVTVPDIPGCFSAGDSLQEAITNVLEAITGHLELLVEAGEEIPEATSIDLWIHHPDYVGHIWAIVELDITRLLDRTAQANITLPSHIIANVDEKIKANPLYKTRSDFIEMAVKQFLQKD